MCPATAVALGAATIGLATDTAGSVRVPASYQGLWGLRTTHGSVPVDGMVPLSRHFDAVGREKGEAYLRQLAQNTITRRGRTLLVDLLSAGEYPMTIDVYAHRIAGYIKALRPDVKIVGRPTQSGNCPRWKLVQPTDRAGHQTPGPSTAGQRAVSLVI